MADNQSSTDVLDDLLSDTEAAKILGRTTRTLKRWRDLGDGPAYTRIGRSVKYPRAWLAEYVIANKCQPAMRR